MDQNKAIKVAINLNIERADVFCPIIKGTCKTNCDWYDRARPHRPESWKNDSEKWTVLGGYCEPKLKKDCGC